VPAKRLSVRVEPRLLAGLRRRAALARTSESAIVRDALETYLSTTPAGLSAYDLALQAGLIGCVKSGPRDLSTNLRHFEGFGE
jgi:hypothetical protein